MDFSSFEKHERKKHQRDTESDHCVPIFIFLQGGKEASQSRKRGPLLCMTSPEWMSNLAEPNLEICIPEGIHCPRPRFKMDGDLGNILADDDGCGAGKAGNR